MKLLTHKRHTRNFYDQEASIYDATREFWEGGYGGKREKELLSSFVKGPLSLNVACGTGRLLTSLLERGVEVVGLDLSKQMITLAKEKTKTYKHIHLILGDAMNLPFREDKFHTIICQRAFKFFPEPRRALNEGYRCLKFKGKYIITYEPIDLRRRSIYRYFYPIWKTLSLRYNPEIQIHWINIPDVYYVLYSRRQIRDLMINSGFQTCIFRCVIYFGRYFYEVLNKWFPFLLRLSAIVDAHNKEGAYTMVIGYKLHSISCE